MTYDMILILMGAAHLFIGFGLLFRYVFRKAVKIGDTVGVRFGDYVVNRKIQGIVDDRVLVKSYENNNLIYVSKTKLYMRSVE